jgi:hypothetical protein
MTTAPPSLSSGGAAVLANVRRNWPVRAFQNRTAPSYPAMTNVSSAVNSPQAASPGGCEICASINLLPDLTSHTPFPRLIPGKIVQACFHPFHLRSGLNNRRPTHAVC